MFLKALYDYAMQHHLLDELPLQSRAIDALIVLNASGELRTGHLIPLTQKDEKGKERPGQECLMPRFPGENNGGKAYFLAEGTVAVVGRDKETGEPIPADPETAPRPQKNPSKAFRHFWQQIEDAYHATKDGRLAGMLAFRRRYLREIEGKVVADLPFLEVRPNKKTGKLEFVAKIGPGADQYLLLKKATLGFSVDGQPLTMHDADDPLRAYWFAAYSRLAFQDSPDEDSGESAQPSGASVCLVTGEVGQPVARSHKPRILGVPGLTSGGYLVSFAKEAGAYSSYGLEMGDNAPVSEAAASAYALALNRLLADEDLHFNLGPVAVCFWAKERQETARVCNRLLNKMHPEQVKDFLRQPFTGIFDREVLHRERIYTVAIKGNAGRVVVLHWLSQTLEQALKNFSRWEDDLSMVDLYREPVPENAAETTALAETKRPPPLAIPALARVSLRRSKAQKDDRLVAERIVQLYRSAQEGTTVPLAVLKPVLDEFQSALIKDSKKTPMYPLSVSRFALIKLILIRNGKDGDFMPEVKLAETNDPAYNCGRLLAVLQALQNRSRRAGKPTGGKSKSAAPGAGVIERYYGRASTAPASVFSVLLHLSRHHLSKLQQGNEKDKRAAVAIERRKGDILARFHADPGKPGGAPEFPALLRLAQQGRFALGFYQQKAYDYEQWQKFVASQGHEGEDIADDDEEVVASDETAE